MALGVFAYLGIADILSASGHTAAQIAERVECDTDALRRLLLFLAEYEVLRWEAPDKFTANEATALLRTDHPDSFRDIASLPTREWHWNAWGDLLTGVKTGETPFQIANGAPFFEYLSARPEDSGFFNRLMGGAEESEIAIASVLDVRDISTVVDVGGGRGVLLSHLLKRHPKLTGVLSDLAQACTEAETRFSQDQLTDRVRCEAGSFFDAVPSGDLLILKWILHDWNDHCASRILKNCRDALAPQGKLVVLEYLTDGAAGVGAARSLDLQMFVSTGGRERSTAEFSQLLEAAGFRVTAVAPVPCRLPIFKIEAVAT